MKKLNFGCGSIQPEGWTNVDSDESFNTATKNTADFSSDEFDFIVAHCVLQTVEYHAMVDQLKELRRILKPGGILRISLPDIQGGFIAYDEGDINYFPNSEADLDDRFSAWLTWYSTSKTLLTVKALYSKLYEAGFTEVAFAEFQQPMFGSKEITELDTREGECYFVEAKK